MRVTRRDLLRGVGKAAGAVLLFGRAVGASHKKKKSHARAKSKSHVVDTAPLSGSKMYEDLISYYNLGEHRTATEVDRRTSQWMAEQLRAAGLKTATQSFSLRQFLPRRTHLSIGDRSIRSFPLWFPHSTGSETLTGPLVGWDKSAPPASIKGKLALVRFPAEAGAAMVKGSIHYQLVLGAASAGAIGVVAITESVTKEIVALNCPAGSEPWPIPVVLVGSRDEQALIAALRSPTRVSLELAGEDVANAEAKNVIGRVDRGKDLIVVSTPQSGWFRCAGERGPGIGLFLSLARWANRRPGGSTFLFVSSSGHELGALGMSAFLKELAPGRERVLCWIHLGAGIATYTWEDTGDGLKRTDEVDSRRYLMTTPDMVPMLTNTFASCAGLTPGVGRAVGEYELIMKAGYRGFGIAAAHRFHHTPADSPETTGPELLEPVGRALVASIESLEKTGKV